MNMVSVIIPIYNSKKYLSQCVCSVLNQSYRDIRIILVDDGSTDGSAALVDDYVTVNSVAKERTGGKANPDSGADVKAVDMDDISVIGIHQENMGVSVARNAGLFIADSQYILFLDSDDFLEKDCIETLVRVAEAEDLDMVVMPTRNVSADGKWVSDESTDAYRRAFDGRRELIRYNATPRLYRTSFLKEKKLHFSKGELMEDVVFCLEANRLAGKWKLIDYYGYCYRLNPDGIVGGFHKAGIPDEKIPYKGLRRSVEKVLDHKVKVRGVSDDVREYEILEYCTVRILVTILFVFCKKSSPATVRHMCAYTRKFLGKYFPEFYRNPYFKKWDDGQVPFFQSLSVKVFAVLYRTGLLELFALIYTRF